MRQAIIWAILLLCMMALAESFADKCKTVCEQDGDETGILHNGRCGCWNPRDVEYVPIKIPRTYVSPNPPRGYYE